MSGGGRERQPEKCFVFKGPEKDANNTVALTLGWVGLLFGLLVADGGKKRHRKKKFEDLFESPLWMSEQTKETCPFSELRKFKIEILRTSNDYVSDDNTVALMS